MERVHTGMRVSAVDPLTCNVAPKWRLSLAQLMELMECISIPVTRPCQMYTRSLVVTIDLPTRDYWLHGRGRDKKMNDAHCVGLS
jgi:hypothetical protein